MAVHTGFEHLLYVNEM